LTSDHPGGPRRNQEPGSWSQGGSSKQGSNK